MGRILTVELARHRSPFAITNEIITLFEFEDHFALGFEVAGKGKDFVLRACYLPGAHWPHHFHVFLQHVRGARRHRREDVGAQILLTPRAGPAPAAACPRPQRSRECSREES